MLANFCSNWVKAKHKADSNNFKENMFNHLYEKAFHGMMTELPQYLSEIFPNYMNSGSRTGLWTAIPYARSTQSKSLLYSVANPSCVQHVGAEHGLLLLVGLDHPSPAALHCNH